MSYLMLEGPDGQPIPAKGTADGYLITSGGGGGGGEATAANQEAALDALDLIYDALQLVGTEVTSGQILAAVNGLGAGATLADLAAALAPLATEVTQQQILTALAPLADAATEATALDILAALGPLAASLDVQAVTAAVTALGDGKTLDDVTTALAPLAMEATQANVLAALQAQGVDIAAIQSNVALLVPDLDAVRVATQSTDAKTPAPGQALAAASVPVVLPAAQLTTLTPLASVGVTSLPALSAGTNTIGKVDQGAGGVSAWKVDGSAIIQPVSHANLDVALSTLATQATLAAINTKIPSSPATDRATAAAPFAVRLSDGSGFVGVALDATLTGGTQIAIAKGPIAVGAAVGAEKPVLFGGTDGTNVQMANIDSTGAIRLQSGGSTGAAVPARATQIGITDGTNLRALRGTSGGYPQTALAPQTHSTKSSALPAAASAFTILGTPGILRRIEWRYTQAGTKYICLFDQAGGAAVAASWTHWYRSMTNGNGLSWFEFPEGRSFLSGIVVGVSATEPTGTITPSVAAGDQFILVDWSVQPT